MERVIACIFSGRTNAENAWIKLAELEQLDDIIVYRKAALEVGEKGGYRFLKDNDNVTGWGSLAGMSVGSLVGLIGGPLGMIMGALTGSMLGSLDDLEQLQLSADYVSRLKDRMLNGTYAILIHAFEYDETFLDSYMKEFNAWIQREAIQDVYDDYSARELEEAEEEINKLEASLKDAADEEKDMIKRRVAEKKQEMKAMKDKLKEEWRDYSADQQVKLNRLEGKIKSAKSAQQQAITDERAKLSRSWTDVKERLQKWVED